MHLVLSLLITLAPASADKQTVEWVWPLAPPPAVVRPFRPPSQPWLAGHRGVDLAGRAGQEVRAAGGGVVTFAAPLAGRPVVVVSHGDLRTTYEPVQPTVSVGDRVRAGSSVGALIATGSHCGPAQPCLHWGLLRGATYLDPLSLLWRGPIRLLPTTDGFLRSPGRSGMVGIESEPARHKEGGDSRGQANTLAAPAGPVMPRARGDGSGVASAATVALTGALALAMGGRAVIVRLRKR